MSRYGSRDFGYEDRYDRLTNYGNTRSQSSPAYRQPPSDSMYDDHYGRGISPQDRGIDRRRSGVRMPVEKRVKLIHFVSMHTLRIAL